MELEYKFLWRPAIQPQQHQCSIRIFREEKFEYSLLSEKNSVIYVLMISLHIYEADDKWWTYPSKLSSFSIYTPTSYSPMLHFFLCFPQGNILEKLRICSIPRFLQFVQDLILIRKNPNVAVTDMHFGTVPVRLFKPKEASSKYRRGIIFYHGGGAIFGSLGKELCVW